MRIYQRLLMASAIAVAVAIPNIASAQWGGISNFGGYPGYGGCPSYGEYPGNGGYPGYGGYPGQDPTLTPPSNTPA